MSDRHRALLRKYDFVAWFYDVLNYPWERTYRKWRAQILQDVHGRVLEIGVGTGKNLTYYADDVALTGIDLSKRMLKCAQQRALHARCKIELIQADATAMSMIPSASYDWLIGTFICCVIPDVSQPLAFDEFARVLKPGGRLRLLEIRYSEWPVIKWNQRLFSWLIEQLYGARFDRHTLEHLAASSQFTITKTTYVKDDTYLLIDAVKQPLG